MALKKYMTPEQLEAAVIKTEAELATFKKLMKENVKTGRSKETKSAWEVFMYGEDIDPEPIVTSEIDDPEEPETPPDIIDDSEETSPEGD